MRPCQLIRRSDAPPRCLGRNRAGLTYRTADAIFRRCRYGAGGEAGEETDAKTPKEASVLAGREGKGKERRPPHRSRTGSRWSGEEGESVGQASGVNWIFIGLAWRPQFHGPTPNRTRIGPRHWKAFRPPNAPSGAGGPAHWLPNISRTAEPLSGELELLPCLPSFG